MNYIDQIKALGACTEAVEWLRKKNYKSLKTAWRYCPRGDWMMWLVNHCDPSEDQLAPIVLVTCEFVELATLFCSPVGEELLAGCTQTARSWVAGEATLVEFRVAAEAAWAATLIPWPAVAAEGNDAWAARVSMRAAAEAAEDAGEAAEDAGDAAEAAWAATNRKCADIVRKHLSCPKLKESE